MHHSVDCNNKKNIDEKIKFLSYLFCSLLYNKLSAQNSHSFVHGKTVFAVTVFSIKSVKTRYSPKRKRVNPIVSVDIARYLFVGRSKSVNTINCSNLKPEFSNRPGPASLGGFVRNGGERSRVGDTPSRLSDIRCGHTVIKENV